MKARRKVRVDFEKVSFSDAVQLMCLTDNDTI
jgi:hypothetical protein